MRRYTSRILIALAWVMLAPATAQATWHKASSAVDVDYIHMAQHLGFADGSGKVHLYGTQQGLSDEYTPFIYLQRWVYSKTYLRHIWENVDMIGATGPFYKFNDASYSISVQWTPHILHRIRRLEARGSIRLLGEIDTFNVYTQRWATVQSTALKLS